MINANIEFTSTIRLLDITEVELKGLQIDPRGPCAASPLTRDSYKTGKTDNVIVRAVMAQTIGIRSQDKSGASVHLIVPTPSGTGGISPEGNREGEEIFNGRQIYFAHLVKPVTTTLQDITENVEVGRSIVRLGECSVIITGLDAIKWTGDLNCDSDRGHPAKKLNANLGGYDGVSTENGVSYSIMVSEAGRHGFVMVEMNKWVVLE